MCNILFLPSQLKPLLDQRGCVPKKSSFICSCCKIISFYGDQPSTCGDHHVYLTQQRHYNSTVFLWLEGVMAEALHEGSCRWMGNDISHDKAHSLTPAIPFCNSLSSFLLTNHTKPLCRCNPCACSYFPRLRPFLQEIVAERSGMQLTSSKQKANPSLKLHFPLHPCLFLGLKLITAASRAWSQSQGQVLRWIRKCFTHCCRKGVRSSCYRASFLGKTSSGADFQAVMEFAFGNIISYQTRVCAIRQRVQWHTVQ